MAAGFTRRWSSDQDPSVYNEIEGVDIIDLPTPGPINGVGTGTAAIIGEFADMQYGVTVDVNGNVTTDPKPVVILNANDMLAKLGGFDPTTGNFGNAGGNGFCDLNGRSFAALVAVPVNRCSSKGIRAWRQLPTNTSATNPTPTPPMQAAYVNAATEFKTGADRVLLGTSISFSAFDAYLTGIDGDVTAVAGAATSGSTTNAPSVTRDILIGQHTDISIDGGASVVYLWGGTQGTCKMAAAGGYAGNVPGTFTIRWALTGGSFTTAVITVPSGIAAGELALLTAINGLLAASQVPAYIEDSGDANKLRFVTTRYGSTANVSITAVSGAGFTAETGIAVTAATASGTATLKKDGGGVTSVTIPFLDVATDAQIAAAIVTGGVGQPTGGTILATGTGGALVATVTATGAAHSIQIVGTSTNSLGFDNAVHAGTNAGAGGGTALDFVSAGSNFLTCTIGQRNTPGVLAGDILVTGVIGGAGALDNNAFTLRVQSVTNATTLVVEQLDGSSFNWSTYAALPWRLHVSSVADTGGAHALSAVGGYTIPARPLDATVAAATLLTPTIQAPAVTYTSADPLAGLYAETMPGGSGALVYTSTIQAPNAVNDAAIDALYALCFDALNSDSDPAQTVDIVWASRCSATINSLGRQHAITATANGLSRGFLATTTLDVTDISDATGNVAPNVGATRDEVVWFSWPGVRVYVPAAVGYSIATADGNTTTDGILDVSPLGNFASVLSLIGPERNPGEETPTTAIGLAAVRGYQRGVNVNQLNLAGYILLKRSGVCAIRNDSANGRFVFQSGVSSSLVNGQKDIARRRFAWFVEDSIAADIGNDVKLPLTPSLQDTILSKVFGFLNGLLSPGNSQLRRIRGFTLTDDLSLLPQNIYLLNITVAMQGRTDALVLRSQIGPNVGIVTNVA